MDKNVSGRMRRVRTATVVASCLPVIAAFTVPVVLWLRLSGTGPASTYFVGDLDGPEAWDVAVSPDGQILAAAGGNDHSVTLWDAHTGAELRTLAGDSVVNAIAFSRDGMWLASSSNIFEPLTGERLSNFSGGAYDVAFSPDGTTVATANGYEPNGVRLFDSSTGALIRTVTDQYARAVAFSPDGTLLAAATGYLNAGVTLWRVDTGEQVRVLDGGSDTVAYSPDGRLVATSGRGATQLWDPATGMHVRDLSVGVGFGFSPDGTVFAGADEDGVVVFFDPVMGDQVRTLSDVHAGAVAFSPDGQRILVLGLDGAVRVVALD